MEVSEAGEHLYAWLHSCTKLRPYGLSSLLLMWGVMPRPRVPLLSEVLWRSVLFCC